MDTTFGDLLDGAWTHLGGATMHAHPQLDSDITAAAKDACRSLTSRLARCVEDFARADGIAQPIHEASRLLTRLGGYTSAAAAAHPLALHLRAASTSWGAAGDMLATHFTRRGDAARSDWAAVISDEQVRDGLLSEVADHTLALVAVMDRSGLTRDPDTQTACSLLHSVRVPFRALQGTFGELRHGPYGPGALPDVGAPVRAAHAGVGPDRTGGQEGRRTALPPGREGVGPEQRAREGDGVSEWRPVRAAAVQERPVRAPVVVADALTGLVRIRPGTMSVSGPVSETAPHPPAGAGPSACRRGPGVFREPVDRRRYDWVASRV